MGDSIDNTMYARVFGTYATRSGMEPNSYYVDTSKLFKKCALPGAFTYIDKNGKLCQVCIDRVMYSNPATIVFWSDGTKTTAKCYEKDHYNPETGLSMCILKKLYSGAAVKSTLEAWLPKYPTIKGMVTQRTLHDVRKELKNK